MRPTAPSLALILSLSRFAIAAPQASAPPVDRVLTLEDSVRLAVNNSQMLLSSREDENIAMQRVHQSETLFFPKLDLNANWSKFSVDGPTPLMLQPNLGPTLISNNPQENYYTFRADIYQTVYEGGRTRNTWRQARIAFERAKDIHESLQIQVASTAKQTFFDLLLAQTMRERYAQVLQRIETIRPVDGMPMGERIRFEHDKAQFRYHATRTQQAEAEARLNFLRALNLELNLNVRLVGELKTHPVDLDLQKLLAWASRFRSELRQTEYQQESDALAIRLSLAERTPRVAFGATYERTGTDIDLKTTNWAGTLNVNLPVSIADMIFGWSKVRERRAQYRQATLKHAETMDQIEKQVRESYADVCFWQEEIPKREQEKQVFEKLTSQAVNVSLGPRDRLDLERYALEADLLQQEAVNGQLQALASLERAVGRTLEDR